MTESAAQARVDDGVAGTDSAREAWDALAGCYDERHGDEGNAWHRLLVEPTALALLGDVAGKRILDLGCGTGVLARRLLRAGARVVGVDGSEEFLERARRRKGGESIEWQVVDATDEVALSSLGAFDAVVCTMVLMDLPDVGPLFRGSRRLLSDGPLVAVTAHPSFNRPDVTFWTETGEDETGAPWSRSGLSMTGYAQGYRRQVYGMPNQTEPQEYFHRPLHELLSSAFDAGFALDGLEEPIFPSEAKDRFGDIPPVLGFRLRAATST